MSYFNIKDKYIMSVNGNYLPDAIKTFYYNTKSEYPNEYYFEGLNNKKGLLEWVNKQVDKINNDKKVFEYQYDEDSNELEILSTAFWYDEDTLVYFSGQYIHVMTSYHKDNETMVKLSKEVMSLRKDDEDKDLMYVLCQSKNGFYYQSFEIKNVDLDIDKHYNDDFKPVNDVVVEHLNKDYETGLILLHGVPGTGKSYYIRHLCSLVKKKIIYIPPELSVELSSPHFIPFLMENPDCILVIEDSENIIKKREGGSNQAVSNLLNISDGILGDCLKSKIICTFNQDKSDIDPALLRKGRLIAEYKFDKLSIDKTSALMKEVNGVDDVKTNMTVSEIYNYKFDNFHKDNIIKKIGFK